MHPLFTRSRFSLYLLAWVPLIATSVYVLATRGGLRWWQASAIAVPVFLFYAFLCLFAWYPCRATPLGRVSFLRLLLTHLIAAVFISFIWTQVGALLSYFFLSPKQFDTIKTLFGPQVNAINTIAILIYLLSVAFHYVLIAMEESRRAETQASEARVLARDAELKALKAQVNPHFLFNSLHSISALTSVDPAKARDMCIHLSDFLRSSLRLGERVSIPFGEELALAKTYLDVEQVRFGERLRVKQELDPACADCAVPPLLVQPLVENAIKHGIATLIEGGEIAISGKRSRDGMRFIIE